jgi:hypothetical protein
MWCLYARRKGDLLVLSCASVHLVCLGRDSSEGCICRKGVFVILLCGSEFVCSSTICVCVVLMASAIVSFVLLCNTYNKHVLVVSVV